MRHGLACLTALLAAAVLASGCGGATDGTTGAAPFTPTDPGGTTGATPPGAEAETPGPWIPSRALALDRFALETALGAALADPVGAELGDSTVWTLAGEGLEVRLRVSTWFDGTDAEMQCRAAAGAGAEQSLALGPPVWTAPDAVFVTADAACIRVSVARGAQQDASAAAAVVAALVTGRAP